MESSSGDTSNVHICIDIHLTAHLRHIHQSLDAAYSSSAAAPESSSSSSVALAASASTADAAPAPVSKVALQEQGQRLIDLPFVAVLCGVRLPYRHSAVAPKDERRTTNKTDHPKKCSHIQTILVCTCIRLLRVEKHISLLYNNNSSNRSCGCSSSHCTSCEKNDVHKTSGKRPVVDHGLSSSTSSRSHFTDGCTIPHDGNTCTHSEDDACSANEKNTDETLEHAIVEDMREAALLLPAGIEIVGVCTCCSPSQAAALANILQQQRSQQNHLQKQQSHGEHASTKEKKSYAEEEVALARQPQHQQCKQRLPQEQVLFHIAGLVGKALSHLCLYGATLNPSSSSSSHEEQQPWCCCSSSEDAVFLVGTPLLSVGTTIQATTTAAPSRATNTVASELTAREGATAAGRLATATEDYDGLRFAPVEAPSALLWHWWIASHATAGNFVDPTALTRTTAGKIATRVDATRQMPATTAGDTVARATSLGKPLTASAQVPASVRMTKEVEEGAVEAATTTRSGDRVVHFPVCKTSSIPAAAGDAQTPVAPAGTQRGEEKTASLCGDADSPALAEIVNGAWMLRNNKLLLLRSKLQISVPLSIPYAVSVHLTADREESLTVSTERISPTAATDVLSESITAPAEASGSRGATQGETGTEKACRKWQIAENESLTADLLLEVLHALRQREMLLSNCRLLFFCMPNRVYVHPSPKMSLQRQQDQEQHREQHYERNKQEDLYDMSAQADQTLEIALTAAYKARCRGNEERRVSVCKRQQRKSTTKEETGTAPTSSYAEEKEALLPLPWLASPTCAYENLQAFYNDIEVLSSALAIPAFFLASSSPALLTERQQLPESGSQGKEASSSEEKEEQQHSSASMWDRLSNCYGMIDLQTVAQHYSQQQNLSENTLSATSQASTQKGGGIGERNKAAESGTAVFTQLVVHLDVCALVCKSYSLGFCASLLQLAFLRQIRLLALTLTDALVSSAVFASAACTDHIAAEDNPVPLSTAQGGVQGCRTSVTYPASASAKTLPVSSPAAASAAAALSACKRCNNATSSCFFFSLRPLWESAAAQAAAAAARTAAVCGAGAGAAAAGGGWTPEVATSATDTAKRTAAGRIAARKMRDASRAGKKNREEKGSGTSEDITAAAGDILLHAELLLEVAAIRIPWMPLLLLCCSGNRSLPARRHQLLQQSAATDLQPIFREALPWNEKAEWKGKLIFPHVSALGERLVPQNNDELTLIQGGFVYYHYCQDGEDDAGWGCCYRAIQLLFSWYKLQHYTSEDVPSITDIQRLLRRLDPAHEDIRVGSSTWIGTVEGSYVLTWLLKIECRLQYFPNVAAFLSQSDCLRTHLESAGTPIIVGIGQYAYIIIGMRLQRSAGEPEFSLMYAFT